ncbi:MAG: FecCD family ABC transporter permease [Thermoguttaceae bacterium]
MLRNRQITVIASLVLLVVCALFVLPMLGRYVIAFRDVVNSTGADATNHKLYWEYRFPQTVLAMLAGAGLALCGMVFQAMFRNPLATPYTLGVASGASFGTAVYTTYFTTGFTLLGLTGTTWSSFLGALLAMSIVFFLSRSRDMSTERMLLAGVAVNFFFSSLILFLQYISNPSQTFRILRYTMGGFDQASMQTILKLAPIIAIAAVIILLMSRTLNVMLTGDDRAVSLGVDVNKCKTILFFLSSLLVGAIVAVTGPIGFVGLMVPHLCRLGVGSDHRILAPATLLCGAVFLAVCDRVACSILLGSQIPVGIITSLLGGPFFIALLLYRK